MPDSDTSTEINVKLYDKKGKINDNNTDNKKSSDTDYYFNLLANFFFKPSQSFTGGLNIFESCV
jgi:hypothetical protein